MTGVQNKPLWSVASETRRQVEPSLLGESVVHYSIPSVDAYGIGQVESTVDIHSAKLLLRGGEVLISKLNPRKSRVVIVQRDDLPVVSSTEFIGLQAGPHLEDRFLAYFLQSEAVRQNLDARVQSVTRSHQRVAPEDVLHLHIELPGLGEQRRIADFLDAETSRIDRLIDARNRQISLLKERWDSILASETDELYGRFGAVSLGRVTCSLEQGWSPQCDEMEAALDEWAVLKTSAVSSGRFKPFEHKRLPSHIVPDIRYRISDGDILLTRGSGSPENVGVAVVAETEGRRLLLSDLLYRLRIDPSWSPRYVCLVLRSVPVRGRISLLLRGQSGQTIKLRSQDIRAIDVPNLPVDQQEKIVLALGGLESSIGRAMDALKQSVSLLDERQRALVTAAVTGQFDVTTASGRNLTQGV